MTHWTDPLKGVADKKLIDDGKRYNTFADWWRGSKRGDYMLWLLDKVKYRDDRTLRLLACRFVRETRINRGSIRTMWDVQTSAESRRVARETVRIAERYVVGLATDAELDARWDATSAAKTVVRAAVWVIAWATAVKAALAQQADIVRSIIPAEEVEPIFERYALRYLPRKTRGEP